MKKLLLSLLCIVSGQLILSMEDNFEIIENSHEIVCQFIEWHGDNPNNFRPTVRKEVDHHLLSAYLDTNPNFNDTFERLYNITKKECASNPKLKESLLTFAIHNGYCPTCVEKIVNHPHFQINHEKNEINAALWQKFQQSHLISIKSIQALKEKYNPENSDHKNKLDDAIKQYLQNQISSRESILNDFTRTNKIEEFAHQAAQKAFEQLENPDTTDTKFYLKSDEVTDLFKVSK